MKYKDSITDMVVKNINSALAAIPRALASEKETKMKKAKTRKKTQRRSAAKSKGSRTLKGNVVRISRSHGRASKAKKSSSRKPLVRTKTQVAARAA